MTDFRCSLDSEARGEGLAGTASRADRFVLVEFPTPWPAKAVEVFDDEFRTGLVAAADAAKAKLLLVRRHGQRTGDVRRWAVTDVRAQRVVWGTWEQQPDLGVLIDAVGAPSDAWSTEPLVLVCTHALHDACCGVRGRPVAAALTESHGDLVWESSHLGGHRFAANVVIPTDGTYYGRLGAHDAPGVVADHLAGRISADHLRGFSWMPPVAQAVAADVLRRWGPGAAADLVSADVVPLDERRCRVRIGGTGRLPEGVTAEVEVIAEPDARLSCRAEPTPTERYVVVRREADGHRPETQV